MKKISIIIPTYNRSYLTLRSVRSVLVQKYQDFEIIIIDDGSNETNVFRLKEIEKLDSRIRCIYLDRNYGAQTARNTGIKNAKGDWVAFLDSDDEWLPDRLNRALENYKLSNAPVIHNECYQLFSASKKLKRMNIPPLSGNVYKDLLLHPGPVFPGILARKECLERIGYLDEAIVSYQEWDTSIRLAKYFRFAFIPEPLFIYHIHGGDTISNNKKRDADGWAQVVRKHQSEIIRMTGKQSLQYHFAVLAKKYFLAGEKEKAIIYYRFLEEISNRVFMSKYQLQSWMTQNGLNPTLLHIEGILNAIKGFFIV